jgi:hypothetical protein
MDDAMVGLDRLMDPFIRTTDWRYIRSDVHKFLHVDPDLQAFLNALPEHHPKVIFTNARYG